MRTRLLVVVLAIAGAAAIAGALAFGWEGISARPDPSALEVWIARSARHHLIPEAARSRANPLVATPELLARAEDHFVDHCALCHGLDGRGDTEIGRGLSPRPPDLTLSPTQNLSDGELFWIVENGVRLTGMPAFGEESAEDDEHAWSLVGWIRRLPELTHEEIEAMERERGSAAGRAHAHHPG